MRLGGKMMMKQPLVSVIIPAYNASKFIQRCIKSVTEQDYENLQIIIVNDGSTDNTLNICKTLAKEDTRIELYSKKNSGVANTRNYGLDQVKGDYIMFVDSDDYIAHNMISLLLSKINNAGFIMSNTITFDNNDQVIDKSEFKDTKIDVRTFWNYVYNGFWVACIVPWNKLYNRKIFETLRYPAGKTNEDEYLITKIVNKCTSIQTVKENLYFHYRNPKSISNIDNSVGLKFLDGVDALLERVQISLKNQEYYLTDYTLKALPTLFIQQYSLRRTLKYKKLRQKYFDLYKTSQYQAVSKSTRIRFLIFRYFSLGYFLAFQAYKKKKGFGI